MTETSMIPAGYNGAEESGLAQRTSAAAGAGARAELEAMCAMARLNPRDEYKCLTAMVNAAKRPLFAEAATYSFPRGGQNVTGPSVSLMRPLATYWGHIRFGFRIVDDDDDHIGIEGFAHDLQTGAYNVAPDRFKKSIQRRNKNTGKTEWVKPDERDLRELVNRRGAILVRNCVLAVIPPDIVDSVLQQCSATLEAASSGKLKQNREDVLRQVVVSFAEFGVTKEMLDQNLGHPIEQMTPAEHVRLQGMYRSIRDGNTKVADHFDVPKAEPAAPAQPPNGRIDLSQAREGTPVDPPGGKAFGNVGAKTAVGEKPASTSTGAPPASKPPAKGADKQASFGGEPQHDDRAH